MKTLNLKLDGQDIALRLTSAKLVEYAESAGTGGNTLFAVMDALDNIPRQESLFSAALTWPGNQNTIQDGADLLDALIDEDYDPVARKELVLDLAVVSGVINRDNAAKALAAIHIGDNRVMDIAVGLLEGKKLEMSVTSPDSDTTAEDTIDTVNPT